MLLNEIFDTKPTCNWNTTATGFIGEFDLDDYQYQIHLDEYTLNLSKSYDLIDFGFTRNGNWHITNDTASSAKVFGAIMNSAIPKIKQISPDIILFGIHLKNGAMESRESLYDKLAKWYMRGSSYKVISDWVSTANGKYKMISKTEITADDLNKLKEFALSIPAKE